MSDLSKIKNKILSFLPRAMNFVPPGAQPSVLAAAQDVHDASSETESALVTTAEQAALPTIPRSSPRSCRPS